MKNFFLLLLVTTLVMAGKVYAAQCSDVFPGPQTFAAGSVDSIESGVTCNGNSCSVSSFTQVNPFPSISPSGDFNSTSISDGVLEHAGWGLGDGAQVTFSGSGTAVIYFKDNDVVIKKNTDINKGGNPANVLLLFKGKLKIEEGAEINAFIYVRGNETTIEKNATINGAISAKNKLILKENSTYNYTPSDLNNLDSHGFCDSATSSADHFDINHSGNGITCVAETVTLKAHLADHTVDTSYLNTVSLTTSTNHGDWSIISGNGTLNNGTADDGAASYSFVAADNGSVKLGLKNTAIETLNINASDGSISETNGSATASEDQNLTFSESGFRFLANTIPDAIAVQIASKDSDIAPSAQTLELQAIRTNPENSACEAVLINNNNIDLAYECLMPSSCSSNPVTINGANIGANNSGSVSTYVPVALDFGNVSDATATFKLNYPDAGQIRLHARYNIPLVDSTASGNYMTGSSNDFVVKPAGLCVEVTDSNSGCTSGVPIDPSDPDCSLFKKAGKTFNLSVKGVAWQSNGESNTDFCTDNATTPNFQLNNIVLSSNLVAPSSGTNANLGVTSFNMAAADNGSHTLSNESVSEVGVFTITATPPSYLGETIAASSSANVGRFYPDHFDISEGLIAEACISGGFTYLSQDFISNYTITAKNTAGVTTKNYKDSFARLPNTLTDFSFGGLDNSISASPVLLSSRLSNSANSVTWINGVGSASSTLKLARLGTAFVSTTDGPFALTIGVVPSDTDGVTVQNSALNLDTDNNPGNDHVQTHNTADPGVQRYGRLVIDNAYGPEMLNLEIPVRTEYWSSNTFINSSTDLCSVNTFDGNVTLITNTDFIITDPVPMPGDSLTEASLSSKTYPLSTSHIRNLILGAPNTIGPLDISLDVPDWLEFNFNGDTTDDDPSARALFGQYRGNDRIIFWREQF